MVITATKNLSTEIKSTLAAAKDNKYTMLYLPIHGVVTALRAMLIMSGADYEFAHPTDWSQEKSLTPFGSMPVLYEQASSGEILELAELSAIEFYVGQKHGWVGDNLWEQNLVRMYCSSTQSVFDKLVTTVVRAPKPHQDEMMEIFQQKILPEWVRFHERALMQNGANGHYVGEKLTIADIKTASIIDNLVTISGDVFVSREKTPAIMAVYDAVEKIPKYAEWKATEAWRKYDEGNKALAGF
ncbi:hypothetical protein BG003_007675 [Podila horticola]|nr:hypothetical protein BG003_007675 [Podila horticola]